LVRDPLTGEGALLGTTRALRPNEFRDGPEDRCAFCPGNEDLTPPEIARYGDASGWNVRVFRNKFPAIVPPDGDHEVIVDSPRHDEEVTALGTEMWRERYAAALERAPSSYPVLFKNSGAYAGATILHPHTQLVVLPDLPDRWERMVEGSGCTLCDEFARAAREETLVAANGDAAAFVRSHSRFAWSLTILPARCASSLLAADAEGWNGVAALARDAVQAIGDAFPDRRAFNLLVYSDPHADAGSFHWHMEIVPRVSTLAGFELSTGMFIRGSTAQESARRWRRMLAPLDGSI